VRANLHGEYTHRIQWYVIIHAMTSGFTVDVKNAAPPGWKHTPRDLLIKINNTKLVIQPEDWPRDQEGNAGFWDAILDRGPGPHPGFDPTSDGISNPEIFNLSLMDKRWLRLNHNAQHVGLQAAEDFGSTNYPVYKGIYGSLAPRYPNLSQIVSARYVKREQLNTLGNKQQYITTKIAQTAPKTLYQASQAGPKSADGVIERRVQQELAQKHCFLTTACATARQLPDDCEELEVLRRFRDGYLSSRPGGLALIETYYAVAPGIVSWIHQQPDAGEIWNDIYRVIRTAIVQIHRHQYEAAVTTYAAMVTELSRCSRR
jgi:hypothetical protein